MGIYGWHGKAWDQWEFVVLSPCYTGPCSLALWRGLANRVLTLGENTLIHRVIHNSLLEHRRNILIYCLNITVGREFVGRIGQQRDVFLHPISGV